VPVGGQFELSRFDLLVGQLQLTVVDQLVGQ